MVQKTLGGSAVHLFESALRLPFGLAVVLIALSVKGTLGRGALFVLIPAPRHGRDAMQRPSAVRFVHRWQYLPLAKKSLYRAATEFKVGCNLSMERAPNFAQHSCWLGRCHWCGAKTNPVAPEGPRYSPRRLGRALGQDVSSLASGPAQNTEHQCQKSLR